MANGTTSDSAPRGAVLGHLGICLVVSPLEVTSTSCQSLVATDQGCLSPRQAPNPSQRILTGWPFPIPLLPLLGSQS